MKHEYVITFHARHALWEHVVDTEDLAVAQNAERWVKEKFGNATMTRRPAGAAGIFPRWELRRTAQKQPQQAPQYNRRETPFTGVQTTPRPHTGTAR